MAFHIVNGPNLNLLGRREPDMYGTKDFETYLKELRTNYKEQQIEYFQNNVEGELVNYLQQVGFSSQGIILNAGGYTHTSVALADTIAAIKSPVVEVHITNIFAREEYRQVSLLSKNCRAVISGCGLLGYEFALLYFLSSSE